MPMDLPQRRPSISPLAWLKRLFRHFLKRKAKSIHQSFFQWYCETFFPIQEHLTPNELAYVQRCFDIHGWFAERAPESSYEEFSYFTYSHRVRGDQVNSSRIAFGSLTKPDEMFVAAAPILKERKIEVDPYFLIHENSRFYGIGWDLDEQHLKVYFRLLDLDLLPQTSLRTLLQQTLPREQRRPEGLVSFTYIGNQLHEEKVYAYPLPLEHGGELFPGAKGRVLMATSQRGVITQFDVSSTEAWRKKLNPAGQKIIDAYAQQGYTLDTIVLTDDDNFTLYFPGAFLPFLSTVTKIRGR
ncbi:MAG: hypothetical protein H6728_12005 [Myxococcales bacterium]|nr:hypothetical protein [Myxococcales bacterium]